MSEQLGQNVVVDNRGGGNTIIGSELAKWERIVKPLGITPD